MYVEVNGARIFFDTIGPQFAIDGERLVERQTLIVMHGGPGFDHSTMRPYFDRFADTHHVVYIDHRGNGRSTGSPETWNVDQWADDVKALCDALGIVRPVVFGNSFGGMVASEEPIEGDAAAQALEVRIRLAGCAPAKHRTQSRFKGLGAAIFHGGVSIFPWNAQSSVALRHAFVK